MKGKTFIDVFTKRNRFMIPRSEGHVLRWGSIAYIETVSSRIFLTVNNTTKHILLMKKEISTEIIIPLLSGVLMPVYNSYSENVFLYRKKTFTSECQTFKLSI